MDCKLCNVGGFSALAELTKHRWEAHREVMLKSCARGGASKKKALSKRKLESVEGGDEVTSPTSVTSLGSTPKVPATDKNLVKVMVPSMGVISFNFDNEPVDVNFFDLLQSYQYYRGIRDILGLKDRFTAVVEDAMNLLFAVLVEGDEILPRKGLIKEGNDGTSNGRNNAEACAEVKAVAESTNTN